MLEHWRSVLCLDLALFGGMYMKHAVQCDFGYQLRICCRTDKISWSIGLDTLPAGCIL